MAEFLDAQQRNKKHPDSFLVPSKEKLDSIEIGNYVKICENLERFWVELSEVDGDKMVGRVDNDLVNSHSFKCDDIISFKKKNVMDIIE